MPDSNLPTKRMVLSQARKELFLQVLAGTGRVTLAAREASPAHYPSPERTFRDEMVRDPEFKAQWESALDHYRDIVGNEVRRRGVEGWDEPVFHAGEVVGRVRKYDSKLLLAEARRVDPSYSDKGGPAQARCREVLPTTRLNTSKLDDDEKRSLLGLLTKIHDTT